MDFITAIASVTKGLEILKAIQVIDKQFDAASFRGQIADLTVALADAKVNLVDARDEVALREKEIGRLKESFRQRVEDTVVVRGMRYEKRPDSGGPLGMPYCGRCETMEGILIRLAKTTTTKDGHRAVCLQCKSDYGRELGYLYPEDTRPSA